MRRTHPPFIALACLAALVTVSPLVAQQSTTRGFNVGIHFQGSSLKVQDGERSNAGGGGVWLGYGFNRTFQLFLQLDGAEFDVADSDVEGAWTMGHVDLGARFHFANSLRRWVPYLQAALTGRAVSVDNATVNQAPEAEVSIFGGALSLGGGLMIYFSQTLALDLQLLWSGGEFTEVSINNVTVSGFEIDAQSSRFNVGLSWWP